MGFFRQEYWIGLQFPSLGDLPDPGREPAPPVSLALRADSLPAKPLGKSHPDTWESAYFRNWMTYLGEDMGCASGADCRGITWNSKLAPLVEHEGLLCSACQSKHPWSLVWTCQLWAQNILYRMLLWEMLKDESKWVCTAFIFSARAQSLLEVSVAEKLEPCHQKLQIPHILHTPIFSSRTRCLLTLTLAQKSPLSSLSLDDISALHWFLFKTKIYGKGE